ncbi:MAG: SPOR domain-containing protein [Candidatus Omnitrophota bacterium]
MEEEKYQKELFHFEEPKRSFSRLQDMLPKADFEGKISIAISLEKMVFIAIGIIMVLVIVYALGVENGKSRREIPAVRPAKPPEQLVTAPGAHTRPAVIPDKNILNTAPIVTAARTAPPVRQAIQAKTKAATPYQETKRFTILAGSFAKRENAQASALMLTKQGFNATVIYARPYYRVCVGAYSDKTGADAARDLAKVRRVKKDAMFMLR